MLMNSREPCIRYATRARLPLDVLSVVYHPSTSLRLDPPLHPCRLRHGAGLRYPVDSDGAMARTRPGRPGSRNASNAASGQEKGGRVRTGRVRRTAEGRVWGSGQCSTSVVIGGGPSTALERRAFGDKVDTPSGSGSYSVLRGVPISRAALLRWRRGATRACCGY